MVKIITQQCGGLHFDSYVKPLFFIVFIKFKYNAIAMGEIVCTVCLENLMNPDRNRGGAVVTACGHPFHRDCIRESVRR